MILSLSNERVEEDAAARHGANPDSLWSHGRLQEQNLSLWRF